ncbi:MAG: hypothetical protein J5741_03205 [Bacteroidales bacterium]|nr:hypothetical protein [Bacteroidales bacterium]
MKKLLPPLLLFSILLLAPNLNAQTVTSSTDSVVVVKDSTQKRSRFTIGGYGEAVYKYNFFSDNMFRYTHAANYAETRGHGRVDIPHAVFLFGYDFGRGWTFNTEIEFEHGGTESAVEVETEETGEHDCRARTVIEAIMWHGSAQSDARKSVE